MLERMSSGTLLRQRNFMLFVLARFFVMIAGQMLSVAIGWHVYDMTKQPLALGYVGLAIFLPTIGLSLIAGQVADHFDRKRIYITSIVFQTICAVVLAFLIRTRFDGLLLIYTVIFLIGTARAFSGPASQALLPSLVPDTQLSQAVALSSAVWQFAMIAGPSLGGFIYGVTHAGAEVYLVSAALFCVTGGLVLFIQGGHIPASNTRTVTLTTLFAGLKYVWNRKLILGAIALDLFAVLLGGSVALLPIFARDILEVGPQGLGLLRGAPAMGASVMAIFFAFNPLKRRAGMLMLSAVLVFGLSTIGFGLSDNFFLSLAFLCILGAADMVSVIVRQTIIQLATPSEMRGRVSAVSMVFIGASNELGEFESGLTAELFGTVPAVVAGGIGTCLVVLFWVIAFPTLSRVDALTQDELQPK